MGTASSEATKQPARWSLRLFGGFDLSMLATADRVALPSKRDRVLLAYLALSPEHRQPRRKLATLLWGEASDETTLDNLRVCVWSLRKALGDASHCLVASEGDDIVLDIAAFDVDVLTFRRLAGKRDTDLEAATKLYTGELLDGLSIESGEYESWRGAEAARLRDEAVDLSLRAVTQFSESGEPERAIEIGHWALKLQPLHEPIVRHLMQLQTQSGRRTAAIQLYRTLAENLRTELDAQPEAETRALFAAIAGGGKERTDHSASAPLTLPISILPPSELSGTASRASAIGDLHPWKSRKGALMLAGALAALLALVLFVPQIGTSPREATPVAAIDSVPPALPGDVAIAVLPFTNLSSDTEQEFFSDGITEEITSVLARVPNLHVVARTSAFEFKGQNRNIKAIAQQLNATHVIEGSVRRNGDQVRITVQLIQAGTGLHVWTNSYDRQLGNILVVQAEIARAVASALRVPLGLPPGGAVVSDRSIDPETYLQFLRAKSLLPQRGFEGLTEAIKLLEPIVARDPTFAWGWAQLALAYQRIPFYSSEFEYATRAERQRAAQEWLPKSEGAARRAIELNPNLPDGYASLALTMTVRGQYREAEELFQRALALDASYPEALHSYANLLAAVGRTEEALAMRRQLLSLEPLAILYQSGMPDLLWISGETDAVLSKLSYTRSPVDLTYLAKIYAAQGRRTQAADTLEALPLGDYPKGMVENAVHFFRSGRADASVLPSSPRLARRLNFVYIQAGMPERTLERFEDEVAADYAPPNFMLDLWTPIYAPVRKTERFKSFTREAGLVEYWRAKGWPEFCSPTTGDDFSCR